MRARSSLRSPILAAAVAAAAFTASCSGADGPTSPGVRDAELAFVLMAPGDNAIATVSVEVTGPGIDSTLVFNFTLVNGTATGTARVSAGAGRRIVARAFDVSGVNTHRGDTTVTLVEGTNPAVALKLLPLVGGVPLTLSFGTAVVSVSGRDTTLAVGQTLQLSATAVRARGGSVPADSIRWASSNPAVASVSASGLVTALAIGSSNIVASYEGAAARRSVTVRQASSVVASLVFDGTQDYAETPHAADLNFAGDYTLEAWVLPSRFQTSHVVSKWGPFPNASYDLEITASGELRTALWKTTGGFDDVNATVPMSAGAWHHLAVVHAGDSLRLYLDGALVGLRTGVGQLASSTIVLDIGREANVAYGNYFAGAVADIRIWNLARSGAQVAGSRFTRLAGTESGLVAYWRCDEGGGDTVADATGHGHTLRLGSSSGADAADPTWSADGPVLAPAAIQAVRR